LDDLGEGSFLVMGVPFPEALPRTLILPILLKNAIELLIITGVPCIKLDDSIFSYSGYVTLPDRLRHFLS
jgi:hypothetical protein